MDLNNLPEENIELRGHILKENIQHEIDVSVKIIKEEYSNYSDLNIALRFMNSCYSDCTDGNYERFKKLGFWTYEEVRKEIDFAMYHLLTSSYKAAFADLRRALELAIVGVYYSSPIENDDKAYNWFNSGGNTPHFSSAIKKIIKLDYFNEIDEACLWGDNIKELYWELCDFTHTNGKSKSYFSLNKHTLSINGLVLPKAEKDTIFIFCDLCLKIIKELAVIASLLNPKILLGLPLTEKFGFWGPIGYLEDHQVKQLNLLIPDKYKDFFNSHILNDPDLKYIQTWINSLPSLTEEDWKKQAKEFNEEFSD